MDECNSSIDGDADDNGCLDESDYEYDSCCSTTDFHRGMKETSTSLFNQEPVPCPICCEERVEEGCALTLPSCHHSFCVECFTKYLDVEIGRGDADNVQCPFILDGEEHGNIGRKCSAPVGTDVLHEIMTQERYNNLLRLRDAAFVRKNVDYHHCPYPNCDNIVLCKSNDSDEGCADVSVARICDCFKCGNTSCLSCGAMPFHTNMTCDEYREEYRKEQNRRDCRASISRVQMQFPTADRSRAGEEAKFDFNIEEQTAQNSGSVMANVKRCRRCGNGVEHQEGCLKMKCLCGYRFCFLCGSENAQCDCTPSHHGFIDNKTGRGDFAGLSEAKSYT